MLLKYSDNICWGHRTESGRSFKLKTIKVDGLLNSKWLVQTTGVERTRMKLDGQKDVFEMEGSTLRD